MPPIEAGEIIDRAYYLPRLGGCRLESIRKPLTIGSLRLDDLPLARDFACQHLRTTFSFAKIDAHQTILVDRVTPKVTAT